MASIDNQIACYVCPRREANKNFERLRVKFFESKTFLEPLGHHAEDFFVGLDFWADGWTLYRDFMGGNNGTSRHVEVEFDLYAPVSLLIAFKYTKITIKRQSNNNKSAIIIHMSH